MPSDKIIDAIMSFNPTNKGAISVILGLISKLANPPLSRIRSAWEQYLQITFNEKNLDRDLGKSSFLLYVCLTLTNPI